MIFERSFALIVPYLSGDGYQLVNFDRRGKWTSATHGGKTLKQALQTKREYEAIHVKLAKKKAARLP